MGEYYENYKPELLSKKNAREYGEKYIVKLITYKIFRHWTIEEYQEIHDIFVKDEAFEDFFDKRLEYITQMLEKENSTYKIQNELDENNLEVNAWKKIRCESALKLLKNPDKVEMLKNHLKKTLSFHDVGGWHESAIPEKDYKICPNCNAVRFCDESFTCCCSGKLQSLIANEKNIKQKDHPFAKYFFGDSEKSKLFKKNIRSLNNLFAFASRCLKGKQGSSNATLKVNNDCYYCLPEKLVDEEDPRFASIFFMDDVNQLQRRLELAEGDKSRVFYGINNERQKTLMKEIIKEIQDTIHKKSWLVKKFKMLKDKMEANPATEFIMNFKQKAYKIPKGEHKGTYNKPSKNIFCAFVPDGTKKNKRSIIYPQNPEKGKLQYVNDLDRKCDPLHYTLLFPTGTLGWGLNMKKDHSKTEGLTSSQYYRFYHQERFEPLQIPNQYGQKYDFTKPTNARLYAGRLTLQYMVDMAIKIDNNNLRFHQTPAQQKKYRNMTYKGLLDAVEKKKNLKDVGQKKILPSSYLHGRRSYVERYRDAMAIVTRFGKPDLFITMTGNDKWKECYRLWNGRKQINCVHITNRVFHLKLQELLHDLCNKEVFGKVIGKVWVIEYQKRGTPHAHICLILHPKDKPKNNPSIDKMIWAEIPPYLYEEDFKQLVMEGKPIPKTLNALKKKMKELKKQKSSVVNCEKQQDLEMQIRHLENKQIFIQERKNNIKEKSLYHKVTNGHLHRPCGSYVPDGYRQKCILSSKKQCKSNFPKPNHVKTNKNVDGFTDYRRRLPKDNAPGPTVTKTYNNNAKKGKKKMEFVIDNSWVVAYNPIFLLKYQCHVNVEYCGAISAIKYLYKYMFKGTDRGCAELTTENEIDLHKYGRCMTANEGHYRMEQFKLHDLVPTIQRLPYFLPHKKNVTFNVELSEIENMKKVKEDMKKSKFIQWMELNKKEKKIYNKYLKPLEEDKDDDLRQIQEKLENMPEEMSRLVEEREQQFGEDWKNCLDHIKTECKYEMKEPFAFNLTYVDIPTFYRWAKNKWARYKRKTVPTASRLYTAHLGSDKYYLRELLLHVTGIEKIQDFYKVEDENGDEIEFKYLKDVCVHLGLVNDDKEYFRTMEECSKFKFGRGMRQLYCTILSTEENFAKAGELWEQYKFHMVDDFVPKHKKLIPLEKLEEIPENRRNIYVNATELEAMYQKALWDIKDTIEANGREYDAIEGLPKLKKKRELTKEFLAETIYFEQTEELEEMWRKNRALMNKEQSHIFDKVIQKLENEEQIIQMIDAPAGTGKTFVLGSISAYTRSNKKICLNSAYSGVASQLLEGGVTIHKRFNMKINMPPGQNCPINKSSTIANLIKQSKMILMDEVAMMDKIDLERISSTLKYITGDARPFGGKNIIIAGDFRQILPVKRNDWESIESCLKNSYLWKYVEQDPLIINERVNRMGKEADKDYAHWLLKLGINEMENFKINNLDANGDNFIQLPDKLLEKDATSLEEFLEKIYPDIGSEESDDTIVLTSLNEGVHKINDMCLEKFPGDYEEPFISVDECLDSAQSHLYSTDDLNVLNPNSLPRHIIRLKKNTPVMLMRNINVREGLANGTRLKVLECNQRSIFCEISTGPDHFVGKKVFIPKLCITNDNDEYFQMKRYQLPIRVCFAMTINKAQGQTLKNVGLYMPKPCFSHGQLYVALSRVIHPKFLRIFIPPLAEDHGEYEGAFYTKNIVHRNILQHEVAKFRALFPNDTQHKVGEKMFISKDENEMTSSDSENYPEWEKKSMG